jgi:cell division protein FtsB
MAARRRNLRRTSVASGPKPVVKTAPPTLQTTLIFLGLALYLGTTVFRLCVQEFNLFKQAQILEAERTAVVTHYDALKTEIASSRTNAGIEKLAREQLGLVMAQEIPVKTIAPAAPSAPAPVAVAQAPTPATHNNNEMPPAMAALVKFFAPLCN